MRQRKPLNARVSFLLGFIVVHISFLRKVMNIVAFVVAVQIIPNPAPLHQYPDIQQWLFPPTCSQKVCSISLLLNQSLWIIQLAGICGNPWISAYQCKTSSHLSPLLSIRKFPSLGVHCISVGVFTANNLVCPTWKVNPITQLSSSLLHWFWLSLICTSDNIIFLFQSVCRILSWTESHSLNHSSLPHCVLCLLSSLDIGNAAAVHALLHVVFKTCVFWRILGVEYQTTWPASWEICIQVR